MNTRTTALALACLAALASPALQAQGLRAGAGTGLGIARTAPLTAPSADTANTGSKRQADYILAVVNTEPITRNEVRSRMARVQAQLREQGDALPSDEELARQTLELLITERALVQYARETGLKADDALLEQTEANIASQNGLSVTELRRRVEASGTTLARFRAELLNQLLLNRLRERDVDNRVRVSEQEVDQFLREQAHDSAAELNINLGHVLVRVPENASVAVVAERQARAQEVADRARRGEDFAALARAYSDAPEGAKGGQLGLRPSERYPDLFVNSTQTLAVSQIAGPLRSPAGFHVLKVLERERSDAADAKVVQSHARHILLRPNSQLSEAAALERLADYKKRIAAGSADFATLAREHSQDGNAKDGGDLGWTNPGQFVPEFEAVLDTLAPGQISEPLVSRFGVHLVQLLDRRQATLDPRERREAARQQLREKKLDEAYANLVRDVRSRAYVELREPPQ